MPGPAAAADRRVGAYRGPRASAGPAASWRWERSPRARPASSARSRSPTRWESAAVGNAYNVANVAPNIIYDLLLGGILTSVVVPVLVRAARDDTDGGVDFARSLLTLIAITLGIAVLIGMVAAPLIIDLYLDQGGAEHDLAVTFLRWLPAAGGLLSGSARPSAPS